MFMNSFAGHEQVDHPLRPRSEVRRAEVVGSLVDDLLSGKASLRIGDVRSHDPLVIDRHV